MEEEYSEENLLFWSEVNHLKEVEEPKLFTVTARDIYLEFLKPMSNKEEWNGEKKFAIKHYDTN